MHLNFVKLYAVLRYLNIFERNFDHMLLYFRIILCILAHSMHTETHPDDFYDGYRETDSFINAHEKVFASVQGRYIESSAILIISSLMKLEYFFSPV